MAATEKRERILEAAMDLFRERGFGETTMREIAAKAGVATGLAYYYFESKESIVLAFYQRARGELEPLMNAAHREKKLAARLQAMIETKFAYFTPNRRFLGALMSSAADPSNPLSPFHDSSREIREFDYSHFERALQETRTALPADLAPQMAKILWMYQMGLLLFWIYDRSDEQRRARALLAKSVRIVTVLIRLSNLPLLRPARKSVLEIIAILES